MQDDIVRINKLNYIRNIASYAHWSICAYLMLQFLFQIWMWFSEIESIHCFRVTQTKRLRRSRSNFDAIIVEVYLNLSQGSRSIRWVVFMSYRINKNRMTTHNAQRSTLTYQSSFGPIATIPWCSKRVENTFFWWPHFWTETNTFR